MKLSYSAADKYRTCAAMYSNHYIERLRSNRLGSALFFGSAVDEGFNILLLSKKKEYTGKEAETITKLKASGKTAKDIFDYHFTYQTFSKDLGPEDISTSTIPEYYKSDFDPNVLEDEDWNRLEMYIENAGYGEKGDRPDPHDLYIEIREQIDAKKDIDAANLSYHNFCSWLSLRRKGFLMIDTYEREVLPLILAVHSIQREISLPNEDEDEIIGFIDFEGEFVDEPDVIYTIDNKTSGQKYKKDAINDVEKKGQLLLYDEYTENGKAAYIILIKKIKIVSHKTCKICGETTTGRVKTCSEGGTGKNRCNGEFDIEEELTTPVQILRSDIDEDKKDLLFEQIDGILQNIEKKEFSQNRENDCFHFGRKCIYYDYCRFGETKGLVRKVNKK